jgi:hypothetical protein
MISRRNIIAGIAAIVPAKALAGNIPSIRDYGAVPGAADAGPFINTALAANAGGTVYADAGVFYIQTPLVLPSSTHLFGPAQFNKNAGGIDLLTMNSSSSISGLSFYGVGEIYSGRGIVAPNGTQGQYLRNVNLWDFAGYCLEFIGSGAGSTFSWIGGQAFCTNYTTQAAVKLPDYDVPTIGERVFYGIRNLGGIGYDLSGANVTHISDCSTGGILFSSNTRGAGVQGCRIAAALAIDGTWNKISNNIIGSSVTIGGSRVGFVNNTVAGNLTVLSSATYLQYGLNDVSGTVSGVP